jgi:flagellar biogenesis protein FliO
MFFPLAQHVSHLIRFTICLSALLAPHIILAQQLGQRSANETITAPQIFSLFIFLLILGLVAWLLIKLRGKPQLFFKPLADQRIEIVETNRVTVQSTLCLVRVGGHEYLLGITPHTVVVIDKVPSEDISEELEVN